MRYTERIPCPALRPYINCFWMLQSPQPAELRDRTFPDGCQEIVFNIDSKVLRSDRNGPYLANPPVELIGQMTRPYDIITRGSQTYFGVKFYPQGFAAFTRESIHDLRDQSIDPRLLLRTDFAPAVDSVFERPQFAHFVAAMEDHFLTSLAAHTTEDALKLVHRAVARLHQENLPLDQLPAELGVSARFLQLAFKRLVGLSPKQLVRMVRFQTSFRYLHNPRLSLTDVALHCGWYDHAHFAHDFRSLAGMSPSTYRAFETPLNRFFLQESSYAYLCNYPAPRPAGN